MNSIRLLALAPFVFVMLACAYQALMTLQENVSYTQLETEVSFWGRANYQPTAATRERAEQTLARLMSAAPEHPDYLTLRATQLAWESYWNQDKAARGAAYHAQLKAQHQRPAHQQGWAKLVHYTAGMDNSEALAESVRARQQALQPAVESL